jgi:hypothetical protein
VQAAGFLDMSKNTGRWAVMGVVLGLGAPVLITGCGLGVLSRAPDAGQPPVDILLTACDPTHVLSEECKTICPQAQLILQQDCASCHTAENPTAPPPVQITDYHYLVNVRASSAYRDALYVVPGHIDTSLLYELISFGIEPPDGVSPRPTSSDEVVVEQWIRSCVPEDYHPDYRVDDAGSTPPPDAGRDGSDGGYSQSPEAGVDGNFALVPCPADPPTGACSIAGFACPYSTQSCTCTDGSWACQPCPATQPPTGTTCPALADGYTPAAFRCGYGNVTCSCVPNSNDVSDPPTWACGVCPVSAPDPGQACGNTPLACAYADQQCSCDTGKWMCYARFCSAPGSRNNLVAQLCAGFYACSYPALDQSCTCQTPDVGGLTPDVLLQCTCPAAPPRNGGDCVATISYSCSYSDQSCTCDGQWHCTQVCPATAPANGGACGSTLNCSYGTGLCYCDGAAWHCS